MFLRQTDRWSWGLFHPFLDTLCLHFRGEGRVEAERRQSEGRVEASCAPTVHFIIPKKPKIRVPLLRKKSGTKVALDDNNNYNRDEVTVHTPFHKLYGKHNDRQLYTFNCSLFTVKCNEFCFFESFLARFFWIKDCFSLLLFSLICYFFIIIFY